MIALDVLGILLVMCAAMVVGNGVSRLVSQSVLRALEQTSQQWAELAAILSGLLAALAAGIGIGWLVRTAWVRLENLFAGEKVKA
jgi:hypothetical protein